MCGADVSVVLPAHGRAPFLQAAVESILGSGEVLRELLIVDDRLDDAGRGLLDGIEDDRLRVVPCAGVGLVDALNTGLAQAGGEFIARMDADDISLPGRIEQQRLHLVEHRECVAVGGQLQVIDEAGRVIGERHYPTDPHDVRRMLRLRNALAHPAAMFRREAALQAGGYRHQFPGAEDYDLWLRMLELGDIANLATDVLAYRVHGAQITSTASVTVAESTYLAQWSARERRHGRPGMPLPWDPSDAIGPSSARLRLTRGRIALAARLYSRARAAAGSRTWRTAILCGLGWVLLRPRYSLAQALSLRPWLAVATRVRSPHQ
jgi:glycosyltransferase involved in cell wall biosynthesis